jgi:hypothetical protein
MNHDIPFQNWAPFFRPSAAQKHLYAYHAARAYLCFFRNDHRENVMTEMRGGIDLRAGRYACGLQNTDYPVDNSGDPAKAVLIKLAGNVVDADQQLHQSILRMKANLRKTTRCGCIVRVTGPERAIKKMYLFQGPHGAFGKV